MKQLSLLVLASLTTGCFAEVSCWEFIAMLNDPVYRALVDEAHPAGTDILTNPGYAACAQEYDRVQRLAVDKDLNRIDRTMVREVALRLAKRLDRPSFRWLYGNRTLEEVIAREDAFKAGLQKVREKLELLSEKMELPDDLK